MPGGPPPTARAYHTWTLVGGVFYLFGGRGAEGLVPEDDPTLLCAYHPSKDIWVPLPAGDLHGTMPCPRSSHRAVSFDSRMVVFGGAAQSESNEQLGVVET